jgi:hypothetical protein
MLDWVLELVGWSAASPFNRAVVRLGILVAVGALAAVVVVLLGK